MNNGLVVVLALLGVIVASVMLSAWLGLSVTALVLLAVIGASSCLLILLAVPYFRQSIAEREYRMLLTDGEHPVVNRARYRGQRVLCYADGSVAVQTRSGMQAFANFDACRRFIDGR